MMVFCSSVGQTFFIGVFGPQIQLEFDLSHTAWSTIYMIGTLASAITMLWSGPLIDRFKLRNFSLVICVFMTAACLFIPTVRGPLSLCFGIFLLRQSGQALASHTGLTSMARYFAKGRGSALALASLGQSVAEATLPVVAVAAIAVYGWRWTYGGTAIILGAISIPIVFWLLQGHEKTHATHLRELEAVTNQTSTDVLDWTRSQVLRDVRFYLLLPGTLATSMVITAFFFHHLNIAEYKGWDASWITGNYVLYAATSMVAMLSAGSLIDRFSASQVAKYKLVPLTLAVLTIGMFDHYLFVLPYMVFLGLTVGYSHTSSSALWAELYGVKHLGSVKSLMMALSVLASAIGPVIVGLLLDNGLSIGIICWMIAIYTVVANILIVIALRMQPSQLSKSNTRLKP
jgi:MFS family permease